MTTTSRPCPHCGGDLSDGRFHGRESEEGPVKCIPPSVDRLLPPPVANTAKIPDLLITPIGMQLSDEETERLRIALRDAWKRAAPVRTDVSNPVSDAPTAWLVRREELAAAIGTMSMPGVPKWGADSPSAWCERLADGIIGQFAALHLGLGIAFECEHPGSASAHGALRDAYEEGLTDGALHERKRISDQSVTPERMRRAMRIAGISWTPDQQAALAAGISRVVAELLEGPLGETCLICGQSADGHKPC